MKQDHMVSAGVEWLSVEKYSLRRNLIH